MLRPTGEQLQQHSRLCAPRKPCYTEGAFAHRRHGVHCGLYWLCVLTDLPFERHLHALPVNERELHVLSLRLLEALRTHAQLLSTDSYRAIYGALSQGLIP